MKILIVCLGNICRSPLAEGILKEKASKAGLNWQIDSAGTNGYHTGEPPHTLSQKVARKNGLEISKQRSRKFTASDFENYDIIFAMAEDVMMDMERISGEKFDPGKARYFLSVYPDKKNINVPDPWYGEEDGYDEVFTIIDETCGKIIEQFSTTKHMQQ